jgi:hypothetical protein
MKCLVVREDLALKGVKLVLVALLHMFFAAVVALLISVNLRAAPSRWIAYGEWAGALFVLTGVPSYFLYSRLLGGRVVSYAIACALGFSLWMSLGLSIVKGLPIIVDPCAGTVEIFIAVLLSKLVGRLMRGKLVIQDGLMCPNCGYALLGTPGRICSECGHDFGFSELGTSEAEFERKRKFTVWLETGKPLDLPKDKRQ